MDSEIIIGLMSLGGTLIGTFAGILTSSKLTNYRIGQLEKKVEKHNSVMERTALVEKDLKSVWHNIGELKDDIKTIEYKEG